MRTHPLHPVRAAAVIVSVVSAGALAGTGIAAGQSPAPLERITLSALADVSSLDATVTITADGTLGGQAMSGDLTADLSSND